MPGQNFTIVDLTRSLAACAVFPLFAFVPGYVCGWALDLFAFRRRTLVFRIALSIALSVALFPSVAYLVGHFGSMKAVWLLCGGLWAVFVYSVARELRKPVQVSGSRVSGRLLAVGLGVACVWTAVALCSLADLQVGGKLYWSSTVYDYAMRTPMANAIAQTGIPPHSPFYFPGHAVSLRYHYFWFIPSALVVQLAGSADVTARHALIAGAVWSGLALVAVIALYLRLFYSASRTVLPRRILIGALLLGVTGLDILPTLLMLWLHHRGIFGAVFLSVEWWNEQVDGFVYTMLWEPHYVSGLVACFVAFLLLSEAGRDVRRLRSAALGVVAGLALATSVGASIYIAFVFGLFLTIWFILLLRNRWFREVRALLVAGATCVIAALPYLSTLTLGQPPGRAGTGSLPIEFTVRRFLVPDALLGGMGISGWRLHLANAVLLPINYFLEYGFFFVVAWFRWKSRGMNRGPLSREESASITMCATSLLACTFLRSSAVANNDLGWRGLLVAQFVLLLWAVDFLAAWPSPAGYISRRPRSFGAVICLLIGLGAAGTLYDLGILRLYSLLADQGVLPPVVWMASDRHCGARTLASREAYEWVRKHTPTTVRIQFNPRVPLQESAALMYAGRQVIAADTGCVATFGGDPGQCGPIIATLDGLYGPNGPRPRSALDAACGALPVDIFIAKDTDPVWSERKSWIWSEKPIFANQYIRLFQCPSLTAAARVPVAR